MTGPPNALLDDPPATLAPGPANGAFAAGLEGWTVLGREDPVPLSTVRGPAIRLLRNTSLVSPPFEVPAGAQAILVTARAPGVGATLEVRARPVAGGPDAELGVLEPGNPFRSAPLGLAGLAGRSVRLVLDPLTALGRAVDVAGVGPIVVPLPGWTVARGVPEVVRRGGRPALLARDDPLEISSSRFGRGPGARSLLVAVRGAGRIRLDAGSRPVTARATPAWRDVRVPLARRGARARLDILARPEGGPVEMRDLGLVVRETRVRGLRVRRSGRARVVTGRLLPAGAGLPVELRSAAGRRLSRARADAAGRFRLRATAAAPRLEVWTPGDRTRLPGRRRLGG